MSSRKLGGNGQGNKNFRVVECLRHKSTYLAYFKSISSNSIFLHISIANPPFYQKVIFLFFISIATLPKHLYPCFILDVMHTYMFGVSKSLNIFLAYVGKNMCKDFRLTQYFIIL